MAQSSRIPTPLKQHWLRFRVGALPLITFLACTFAMLGLWKRQAYNGSFVGEVAATRVDVLADVAGTLTAPSESYWQLYQTVDAGQTIVRLDPSAQLARLQTVRLTARKLAADLEAARTDFAAQQQNLAQGSLREQLRLVLEVESLRLRALQVNAQIETDKADLKGLADNLKILDDLASRKIGPLVSQTQIIDLRRQTSVVQTRIAENGRILKEVGRQLDATRKRLGELPVEIADVETVLAPIRAEIGVQESITNEIEVEMANLNITAPIGGVISAIYRRPGQRIVAGDPIVTVAMQDSKYIISYVRNSQRMGLKPGMSVGLRLRQPGSPDFLSRIEKVGPHVEPVPQHQLRDQTTPEWATPIKIPIPVELQEEGVRPGQLINVILRSSDGG